MASAPPGARQPLARLSPFLAGHFAFWGISPPYCAALAFLSPRPWPREIWSSGHGLRFTGEELADPPDDERLDRHALFVSHALQCSQLVDLQARTKMDGQSHRRGRLG